MSAEVRHLIKLAFVFDDVFVKDCLHQRIVTAGSGFHSRRNGWLLLRATSQQDGSNQ
jgi:hypothetical protein